MINILNEFNKQMVIVNNIKEKLRNKKKTLFFNNIYQSPFSLSLLEIFVGFIIIAVLSTMTWKIATSIPDPIIEPYVFFIIPLIYLLPFIISFIFRSIFSFYKKNLLKVYFNTEEVFFIKKFDIFSDPEINYSTNLLEYILSDFKYKDIISNKNDIIQIIKNNDVDSTYIFKRYIKTFLFECFEKNHITREELIDDVSFYIKELNINDKETVKETYLQIKDKSDFDNEYSINDLKENKKETISF